MKYAYQSLYQMPTSSSNVQFDFTVWWSSLHIYFYKIKKLFLNRLKMNKNEIMTKTWRREFSELTLHFQSVQTVRYICCCKQLGPKN